MTLERSAKDYYIDLLSQGYDQQDIDDELLYRMVGEQRKSLEVAADERCVCGRLAVQCNVVTYWSESYLHEGD